MPPPSSAEPASGSGGGAEPTICSRPVASGSELCKRILPAATRTVTEVLGLIVFASSIAARSVQSLRPSRLDGGGRPADWAHVTATHVPPASPTLPAKISTARDEESCVRPEGCSVTDSAPALAARASTSSGRRSVARVGRGWPLLTTSVLGGPVRLALAAAMQCGASAV